ncbi:uncharacterized protein AC631_05924 [Debaryomyces fabryi]|uniref:Uncharacterized protein n=1 Tax=Debaryomyces fabryi TaxID=58627 RepID=A0A0V1PPY9_9ASCO|nr:uncharacterized protein AC631_05924 [Debaryomyces fabryi]KRZ98316.1 hypothetical protein AC631_05924 [Debaryomyces fabryi]CUM49399.1 unnamed protein product [Debaryomyces fabryi]
MSNILRERTKKRTATNQGFQDLFDEEKREYEANNTIDSKLEIIKTKSHPSVLITPLNNIDDASLNNTYVTGMIEDIVMNGNNYTQMMFLVLNIIF